MKVELLHDDGLRTYVAVLDKGDEAVGALTQLAEREGIRAASLTAIGAFRRATVGYFDRDTTSYVEIPVEEQVEVLSLVGGIAAGGGAAGGGSAGVDAPKLHAHVVLGRRDGSTCGGHLLEGQVWPTLEVVVTEAPGRLQRRLDPETGLALIDLDRSGPR